MDLASGEIGRVPSAGSAGAIVVFGIGCRLVNTHDVDPLPSTYSFTVENERFIRGTISCDVRCTLFAARKKKYKLAVFRKILKVKFSCIEYNNKKKKNHARWRTEALAQ